MEELNLKERCKLVVWMDQLQSSEMVQLRYKKEFGKDAPNQQTIEEIYNLFISTGSVWKAFKKCEVIDDEFRESRYKGYSDYGESERKTKNNEIKAEVLEELEFDYREEIELFPDDDDDERESNSCSLVSILKNNIDVSNQDYAEISVNASRDADLEMKLSCSSCGFKTFESDVYEAHQKAHAVRDYFRCSRCCFTSNSTSLFRSHTKSCMRKNICNEDDMENKFSIISDTKCHVCDQCGKAYSSLSSLKMHRAFHSKLRPFACDKCDYRFFSEKTLNKHLLTHDKIKHLECPHCSFKCSMSGNMVIHARTHSGEKPYKCSECPYRTGNPSIIKRHMATHKSEIVYKCQKCNYKTPKISLLTNHEKMHVSGSKFQCHICQEELRNSYALRYHITKQHSEQEVLECPFCDFRQKDKALLKIHIRRHTGEKPYGCSEDNCSFRAMRSQDLKKHIRKCH